MTNRELNRAVPTTMKDEDLNAKIATICGWKISNRNAKDWRHWHVKHPESCPNWDSAGSNLPDYCNDLNAMHEAERWALGRHVEHGKYAERVWELVKATEAATEGDAWFAHIHATARQRAEAFADIMHASSVLR